MSAAVDTPLRLLFVDSNAANLTAVVSLAAEEGVDLRTAVDARGATRQCRLDYLDVVMINAEADAATGGRLLDTIRTLRPTVRTVLMSEHHVPIRELLRELRREPRHLPDEFSDH